MRLQTDYTLPNYMHKCELAKSEHPDWTEIHASAVAGGNLKIIEYCENQTNNLDWSLATGYGAQSNKVDVIKYCEAKDPNLNWGFIMENACLEFQLDAVKYCESKGAEFDMELLKHITSPLFYNEYNECCPYLMSKIA